PRRAAIMRHVVTVRLCGGHLTASGTVAPEWDAKARMVAKTIPHAGLAIGRRRRHIAVKSASNKERQCQAKR
ncbi:MAG: hypothetical protein AAF982_04900, partial [Pseudomonadota bacterium]